MHPVIKPVLAQKSIFSPVLERRQKISARADAIIPGKHAQENTIPPIPKIMDAFAILLLFSIALLLSFVTILPFFPCLVNRANFLKTSKSTGSEPVPSDVWITPSFSFCFTKPIGRLVANPENMRIPKVQKEPLNQPGVFLYCLFYFLLFIPIVKGFLRY